MLVHIGYREQSTCRGRLIAAAAVLAAIADMIAVFGFLLAQMTKLVPGTAPGMEVWHVSPFPATVPAQTRRNDDRRREGLTMIELRY